MKLRSLRHPLACSTLAIVMALLTSQLVLSATVTISGKWDKVWITPSTHEYCVQNNVWGASTPQTLEVDDQSGAFTVTVSGHNNSTNGAPASYPSIFRGNHWGTSTNNSGMPKQVGSITSVNTSWNISVVGTGAWNCAYDLWFHKTGDYTGGSPNGAELMIWINYLGSIQPGGSQVTTVSLAGATWEVWFRSGSPNYIAYRRTTKTTSASFDLNAFIGNAVSRGYISNSWYLTAVEAGFEIWQGGAGLASNSFSATMYTDVGITDITPSSPVAYPTWVVPENIYVTVKNYGDFTKTFPVTLYSVWDNTDNIIDNKSVTLNPQENKTLTYNWTIPTIPFAYPYPTYTFKAIASLAGDMYLANNALTEGSVTVNWPGDCNGDGKIINFIDYAVFANSWLDNVGGPYYNPVADFNGDGTVNYYDLGIFTANWLLDPPDLPLADNQKVEGLVNPTHLTTFTPTLSWNYAGPDSITQTKRQIQVGTSENGNDMWDSAVSTSSTSAAYAGTALSKSVTYCWRVKVYNGYEWSRWCYGGTFGLYPPHAPIYINDNDNFTPANGVNGGGSGTADDPFIIENWTISASGVNGIYIKNTTAYFIVRNCLVENGGSAYTGIYLDNVINGRIENNTCRNNKYGIWLVSSFNNNLTGNICRNNHLGIFLWDSSNYNTLSNNTCENSRYGIHLFSSSSNNLTGNTCENNDEVGICLISSSYDNLINNTCENNSYYGILLFLSSNYNTLTNNTCENNSLDGINLASSDNNTVFHNHLLNNTTNNAYDVGTNYWDNNGKGNYWSDWQSPDDNHDGIVDTPYSIPPSGSNKDHYPLVIGYSPSHDHAPILIIGNDNFTPANGVNGGGSGTAGDPYVIENWAINGSNYGIRIQNTTKYFIIRNCLVENSISIPYTYSAGIDLDDVINGKIENNTCRNNSYGILLAHFSDNNTLSNNTCENNSYGIYLYNSSNNTLSNNTCENNRYNLSVFGFDISYFDHDIDNSNLVNGKPVYYLKDNSDLVINSSWSIGYLGLVRCDNIRVENLVLENNDQGILLVYTENSLIENCVFSNNSVGILLYSSSNNTLSNNTCENNTDYSIYLLSLSSNNTLSNNTCENNNYGIFLGGSSSNTLSNNTCENNNYGIYLASSSNDNLTGNTCSNNYYYGILLAYFSDNNTLSNNTCENNSYGIYLASSDNNTITLNYLLNNTENNAYDSGTNSWDNGSMGNYWSDWQPPEHPDNDSDGVVDENRPIAGGANQDRYPLVKLVLGDVDCDGEVTILDAQLIARVDAELEEFPPDGESVADVDCDGSVTILDAQLIARVDAELEEFPPGSRPTASFTYSPPPLLRVIM